MKKIRYFIGIWVAIMLTSITACHYQSRHATESDWRDTVINGDTVRLYANEEDSASSDERPYPLNSNFEVLADTLWLHLLPFTDTIAVTKGNELVVAEIDIHPQDTIDSVWVKVARDQETIGWIQERQLLKHIVPTDPISRCIHLFSSSHALPFFLVLGVFLLTYIYRAVRKKQIKLIWLNDIDSIFPMTLSLLMAASATIYNSVQHFVPETWQQYYYNPTLDSFQVPFILGLFIISVGLILLVGVAMLDDVFHQTTFEVAFFYLIGVASACIFIYIFFTYVWVYIAYACLIAYATWCFRRMKHSNGYPYACGACGAKMRTKGVCPHCGAVNE